MPRICFALALFLPGFRSGETLFGRIFINSRGMYYWSDQEIARTMDHEITHYVQMRINRNLTRQSYLLHYEIRKYFGEGFAEFVTSLTNGTAPGPNLRKGIQTFSEGRRLGRELDYYVKGYLAFRTIAKTRSVEEAVRIGLGLSPSEWKREVKSCYSSYGMKSIL